MSEYFKQSVEQVASDLKTNVQSGLSASEANTRLQEGRNVLPKGESATVLQIFFGQFKDALVLLLVVAAILSGILGEITDVIAILLIIVLNAALGTYQEYRAEQALAALSAMQVPQVRVRRDGHVTQISAEEIVPGDVILLGEGDRIPADGRVIQSANLQVEEAALTGESHGVGKSVEALEGDNISLGDRKNMVFMGTAVSYGRGEMLVTGTGLKTELGKIASMLMGVEDTKTPLQQRIAQLGHTLVYASIGIVALIFVIGLLRGVPLTQMITTAIGLAVAAVPEGLPAVITIGLSLGASRMIKRNALIRRLPAVETLGSVTIICSDKTGTLTRNEMTTTMIALPGREDVKVSGIGYIPQGEFEEIGIGKVDPEKDPIVGRILKSMALATDAYLETDEDGNQQVVGDTTEGALIVAAQKVGWTRESLEKSMPRVSELPFSSERKAMTTVHRVEGDEAKTLFDGYTLVALTKGAPDRLIEWASYEHLSDIIPLTEDRRQKWQAQVDMMAKQGLRVLGIAMRSLDSVPAEMTPEIERDLILLGLVGILDPARPEAKDAVRVAREAGIRAMMITGDHALTAEAIASDLGILESGQKVVTGAQLDRLDDAGLKATLKETSAFARVSPEHKLRIVKVLQEEGHVVAMTGDGVNDAPALKQADIGVAMGITGTEVSKGAADMVLTDDNFASIVAAVEEGRVIYDNILKFIRYLLSSNVGEILVMFVALLVGLPIPLIAIQILWVNLVTDGLPAIALGFEPGEKGVMKRSPRSPKESIFANGLGGRIIWMAIVLAIVTLIGFFIGFTDRGMDPFSRTLNLENFDRAQMVALTHEELIPADWDSLSIENRIALIQPNGEASFGSEEGLSEIIEEAERGPRTIAFMVLALGQLFHVSAIHAGERESFFKVWFSKNRFLLWAVLGTTFLQILVVYFAPLQALLDVIPLSGTELFLTFALSSVILFVVEIEKLIRNMRSQPSAS